jgi:LytS/YehU family sensor histidine kinase
MPRYLSAALLQKGNQPVFSVPSLQNQFRFENLASGSYNFFLRVFESDGSISIHRYSFIIRKFWWQNWWIWTLFLLTILIPILLFIYARNKARLAREQFMRKEAELNAIRSEQERKLASHKIISLSNQFRPHFVLNALNTIGAGMDDKPGAEIVISRLGESIDLIFRHAQQQKITHSFNDEWRLVENVIEIHRSMYLKELELELPPEQLVDAINETEVPLGLLQLPVENALLHGLGNKEEGPWKLSIKIDVNETSIIVNATDNGVGRKRAAGLSNYRNHGTGLKNLGSILEMLNAGKDERISINYEDGVFREGDQNYGTKVIISIPKNFHYDI